MFEQFARALVTATLVSTLGGPLFAGSGPCRNAGERLNRAVAQCMPLTSGPTGSAAYFEFEYRRTLDSNGRLVPLRCRIRNTDPHPSAVLLSDNGIPYGQLAGQTLAFSDRSAPGKIRVAAGWTFGFIAEDIPGLLKPFALIHSADAPDIRIDLPALVDELREADPHPSFDSRTLTFAFAKDNGSIGRIRLPRERTWPQSPIASIMLENKRGEGVLLSIFQLSLAQHTVPSPRAHRLEPTGPSSRHDSSRQGASETDIRSLLDAGAVAQLLADPRHEHAAAMLLDRMAVGGRFSRAEKDRIGALLMNLGRPAAQPFLDDDVSWAHDYVRLREFLHERIIWPAILIQNRPNAVPRYVVGYDRHRSAYLLATRAGPPLAEQFYQTLHDVVVDRNHSSQRRAAALDMLGIVGVREDSVVLERIRSELECELPADIRIVLATVEARTGTPTDVHVDTLRAALTDEAVNEATRFLCMESLLLMDEAHGFEHVIHDMLSGDKAKRYGRLSQQCLLAAGCSEQGRDVLVQLAAKRTECPPFTYVLRALHSAIRPDDRQWAICMRLMKQIALDESLAVEDRWIAADFAARHHEDHAFRARFTRSALSSGSPRLIGRLVFDYCGVQGTAYKFLDKFDELLNSTDVEVRSSATTVFVLACSPTPPKEHEAAVVRLAGRILEDSSQDVRLLAWPLLKGMQERNPTLLEQLYPELVQTARNATDPSEYVTLLIWISGLSQGAFPLKLPFYPFDDNGNVRTDAHAQELVRKHRRDIQRQLDEWLRTHVTTTRDSEAH